MADQGLPCNGRTDEVNKVFSSIHGLLVSQVHWIGLFLDVNFRLFWHQTSYAENARFQVNRFRGFSSRNDGLVKILRRLRDV